MQRVPFRISGKLLIPVPQITPGRTSYLAGRALVLVPEAPVDEDDLPS